MTLNAVEHSRRKQRRQRTLGRRVLNSGWQVRSVAMLPPNADVAESWHQTRVESCWPGILAPYRVGSDIPVHTACIQFSQGHATNEAARAAEWYGRIDVPRGWDELRHWWLPALCWVVTTVDQSGLSFSSPRGSALDWPRDRSISPASVICKYCEADALLAVNVTLQPNI